MRALLTLKSTPITYLKATITHCPSSIYQDTYFTHLSPQTQHLHLFIPWIVADYPSEQIVGRLPSRTIACWLYLVHNSVLTLLSCRLKASWLPSWIKWADYRLTTLFATYSWTIVYKKGPYAGPLCHGSSICVLIYMNLFPDDEKPQDLPPLPTNPPQNKKVQL
jgi:hypothetical protein